MSTEHKVFEESVDLCLDTIEQHVTDCTDKLAVGAIRKRIKIVYALSKYRIPIPFAGKYAAGRCIQRDRGLEVFIHPTAFVDEYDSTYQIGYEFLQVVMHETIHLIQVMTGKLDLIGQKDTRFIKAIIDHAEEECEELSATYFKEMIVRVDSDKIKALGREINSFIHNEDIPLA